MSESSSSNSPASFEHIPVLLQEVLEGLQLSPGDRVVDVTLGGAGHSFAMAEIIGPTGHLIGLDQDSSALAAAQEKLSSVGCKTTLIKGNFRDLDVLLEEAGFVPWDPEIPDSGVDAILGDFGVSSHQIDTPERGFSLRTSGPLDMRMGDEGQTAAEILRDCEEDELSLWLREYGDMRGSYRIARRIKQAADAGQLNDTLELTRLMTRLMGHPKKGKAHPATRVFQAIRMVVNDELGALDCLLNDFLKWLRPGARAGFISFHSGEDRKVKQTFRALEGPCTCPPKLPICQCNPVQQGRAVKRKAIFASDEELAANSRARSARVRFFEASEDRIS